MRLRVELGCVLRSRALALAFFVAGAGLGCAGHQGAEELLASGKARAALGAIEGDDAQAYLLRGRAWYMLGEKVKARRALRLALAAGEATAPTLTFLAQVESELSQHGAALWHLEAAVAAGAGELAKGRLARLLWVRGGLRRWRRGAARRDFERAHALAPELPAHFDLRRWRRAVARLGIVGCERAAVAKMRLVGKGGGCDVRRAERGVVEVMEREVYFGCLGSRLLEKLRAARCGKAAEKVLEALRKEDPERPRWSLELARQAWIGGRPGAARVLLDEHLYLSPSRAKAALRAARMLLAVGDRRGAAWWAVRAVAFDENVATRKAAAMLLRLAGRGQDAERLAPSSAPTSKPATPPTSKPATPPISRSGGGASNFVSP